jgi:predicted porin
VEYAKYHEEGRRARVEAAFALTAIENLLVDLGVQFGLQEARKDARTNSDGIGIGLGATYNAGDFGIGARADIKGINSYSRVYDDGGDKSLEAMNALIRLVPTYNLGAATIGLDVAFGLQSAPKDYDGNYKKNEDDKELSGFTAGFGVFIAKGLGSGNFKAGLSYTLPSYIAGKANGSGVFQIPIILEYAFF